GIAVGVNVGKYHIDGPDAQGAESTAKAGLAIGGFVEVPVTPFFSVQPELLYMMKPFDVVDSGRTQNEDVDVIGIRLLARINFPSQSKARAYLLAGPGFSFLTRLKETEPNGSEQDIKDQAQTADVSIIAGLGVMIGHFGLEGRYDGGLRNINKTFN